LYALLFGLVTSWSSTSYAQEELTDLTVTTAERVLTTINGVWILKSVDLRPISGDCTGKFTLQFLTNHEVVVTKCYGGRAVSSREQWAVGAGRYGIELKMQNETSDLFLKDEGKDNKHEYHMRIRQDDIRNPKGGINLLHDYQFKENSTR
jgi:hypothetical protein